MEMFTLSCLICLDIFLYVGFFIYLSRKRKLIGIQLGMNISQVMGGVAALLSGIVLILAFPFHFTLITIVSAMIGVFTGALFGLLFDYQTFMTGLTNGMMVGLMAPMIGSVLDIPGQIIWLVHGLFFTCLILVMISIQRS
ncbi:hypothetical protein NLX67_08060 [Domibacillus sp. A3M-37]|uniref:hypothetical protein n=1 Tax=Domibacillus sp. A3M-37 TaxID=2962037 RepID=UPI0020B641F1|nr:hypothetical protein [Domibacillus sp. A3M-37]MCP3762343.1 hypothetical protein [Domibacillus sp. A3M-37]